MVGYCPCRECGKETNVADLVARLCPDCRRFRTAHLASLQQRYETAARTVSEDAASLADEIRAYQQAEGVRLKDVAPAYCVE